MNNYYVYKLTSTLTNKIIYIGKGKNNRMFKHKQHAKNYSCSNKKLERTILKTLNGGGDIVCEKIYDNLSEKIALQKEKETIQQIGIKNLCNLTEGGIGGDCLTNHPNYKQICKKMGDSKRGKKRTEKEIKAIIKGRSKWIASKEFKQFIKQRSVILKNLGKENPLCKYIANETPEQKKERMKNVLSVPRWNKGLTKETSELLRRDSEQKKNIIPINATKCVVKNNITNETLVFLTLYDFKKFLKIKHGSFNSHKLQKHIKGEVDSYKEFTIIQRIQYETRTPRFC